VFLGVAGNVNAQQVEEFYVPLPESEALDFFTDISTDGIATGPVNTRTDIVIRETGTEIVFDPFNGTSAGGGTAGYETGYDAADEPGWQTGAFGVATERWGDGDCSNGFNPNVAPTDCDSVAEDGNDVFAVGEVVVFDSSQVFARDFFQTNRTVNLTRSLFPSGTGTFLAGAFELFPAAQFGNNYVVPVGEDTADANNMFDEVALTIMAAQDGTVVSFDPDGPGGNPPLTPVSLDRGESVEFGNGAGAALAINEGATIVSNAPVQVNVLTGEPGTTYAARFYTLLLSDNYYEAVGTTVTGDDSVVFIFNPNSSSINVDIFDNLDPNANPTTVAVAPNTSTRVVIPEATANGLTGLRFTSQGGEVFSAYTAVDDGDQIHDWGHVTTPLRLMGDTIRVGFAPGNNPDVDNGVDPLNASPIWVVADVPGSDATQNIQICVDAGGNGGPNQDPFTSLFFDYSLVVQPLDSSRLYNQGLVQANNGQDQTGMLAFACDLVGDPPGGPVALPSDVVLAAAWGQDPEFTTGGDSGFDVGTTIRTGSNNRLFLGDQVFEDVDGDGIQDIGELGIPNVTVTITVANPAIDVDPNTTGIQNTVDLITDINGYLFTSLTSGEDYTITVTPPDGLAPVSDPDGVLDNQTTIINLTSSSLAQDFGYRRGTGPISGRVWLDEDQDGINDIEEAGLTNVMVELRDGTCTPLPAATADCTTVTTDQFGNYVFGELSPGDYDIVVVPSTLPVGLTNTFGPFGAPSRSVTLPEGEAVTDQDFGYRASDNTGAIGDRIWSDADGDGIQDPGEAGIAGVSLELQDGVCIPGSTCQTTTTGADGDYLFTNVPFGEYIVVIPDTGGPLSGFTATSGPQSVGGTVSPPVTLDAQLTTVTDIDFGFDSADTLTIMDRVWYDTDSDQTQDAGEPGIPGVTVDLIDTSSIIVPTIIDGMLDINDDGVIDNTDDGVFNAVSVIDGLLDTDGSGTVDDADSGVVVGGFDIVEGMINLAQAGTATQSSVLDSVPSSIPGFSAPNGNDGNPVGFGGSAAPGPVEPYVHTDLSGDTGIDTPYWEVDLGSVQSIGSIKIFNRDNSGGDTTSHLRMGNAFVFVADTPFPADAADLAGAQANADFIAQLPDLIADGQTNGVVIVEGQDPAIIADTSGRYVRVQLSGFANVASNSADVLNLAEVKVTPASIPSVGDSVVVATTTTDENGDFTFTGVPEGSAYVLKVTDRDNELDGLTETTTTNGSEAVGGSLDAAAGGDNILSTIGDDTTPTFGYNNPGSIAGIVWSDFDEDGTGPEPGEPGIGGVVVSLTPPLSVDLGNGIGNAITTLTAPDGSYLFDGLPPGDYDVDINSAPLPNNTFDFDSGLGGDNSIAVTIGVGEGMINQNFGYDDNDDGTVNNILGTVFLDPDKDGVEEAGEPGIPGVTLDLISVTPLVPAIINGMIDIDNDGAITAADDGVFDGVDVIDGMLDVDDDGDIDENDSSALPGNSQVSGFDVIEGMINLAQAGSATQSSTGFEGDADPNVVLDGNPAGGTPVASVGPFIHTLGGIGTDYWEVDLGSVQSLGTIKVFNRDNVSSARLENVVIFVADTPFPVDPTDIAGTFANADFNHQILAGDLDDPDVTVGVAGRYVRLQKTDGFNGIVNVTNFLHIAEIKITPALIPATQSGVIASTTTDANGDYAFLGLPDGDYQVAVTDETGQLAGFDITSGLDVLPVTLNGADVLDVDFGYIKEELTGSIAGEVFIDENINGTAQNDEFDLTELTVYLCLAVDAPCTSGNQIQNTTTDANGEYAFTGLPPGTYEVGVESTDPDLPANLTPSVDPAPVLLSEGENVTEVDIGYVPDAGTGVLSGFVWTDADNSGAYEIGEAPIGGVTITVFDGLSVLGTTVTEPDGSWILTNIPLDAPDLIVTYTPGDIPANLDELRPTNLVQPASAPFNDRYIDLDLFADPVPGLPDTGVTSITNLDFGFQPDTLTDLGSIAGTIYSDTDQNNSYNPGAGGDVPLNDITLNLIDCDPDNSEDPDVCGNANDEVIASTTTGPDGIYSFTGLQDGTYDLQITDQANELQDLNENAETLVNPDPGVIIVGGGISLTGGADIANQDAGFIQDNRLRSIGNRFWFDTNGNGIDEDREPGIAGITVQCWLDVDASETAESPGTPSSSIVPEPGVDNLIRTVETDDNGEYFCTSLPPGQYIVTVADAGSFNEVDDGTDIPGSTADGNAKPWNYVVTLLDGVPSVNADFGVSGTNEISGTIFVEERSLVEPDNNGTLDNTELDGTLGDISADTSTDPSIASVLGIPVRLFVEQDGELVLFDETTTAADGTYSFDFLPDGSYRVEVFPDGSVIDGFGQTGDPDTVLPFNPPATAVPATEASTCDSDNPCDNATTTLLVLNGSDQANVNFGYQDEFQETPVTLTYFTATEVGGGVSFSWQSTSEIGHAGYQIYARGEQEWELVNEELIVGQSGPAMQTREYSYTAYGVDATWFALVDVAADEDLTVHGPYRLGETHGEPIVEVEAYDWSGIKLEPPSKADVSESVGNRLQQLLEADERAERAQSR